MPFIPKCPPATIAFKSSGLPPPNLQTENTCPSIINKSKVKFGSPLKDNIPLEEPSLEES